jgi:ketosteroid isomerase-like protein
MQEPYAEDAVFDVSAVFTDVAPIRGHQDMLRFWKALRETWEGMRLDPLEILDVGDGRYVLEVRLWGKGRQSGAEADQRFAFLYTLRTRDWKILRADLLPDVTAAIAAAESPAARMA